MSTKILQSMYEEDSAAQRRIGCMNGILHLFERQRYLPGRRIGGGHGHHKRRTAGEKCSLDTQQAKEVSHISMRNNTKPMIDKQSLLTDSSRSSVSSSSFSSSIDDTKITLQSSEISKLVRESILHRNVREITVKASSKEESRALTYVDSPRPSLPSPQNSGNPAGIHESLGAFPSFHKFVDRSSYLLHKESPRYSYDERGSKPNMKMNEFPRYSLDSNRPNCSQLDRVVSSKSSLVAKLMGLEDLEEPKKDSSFQVSVQKPSSRIVPVELAPWKGRKLDRTQCLASQGNVSSVYGEMEKRLAQLDFAKLGKDFRALQSMQEPKTETCSTPCSPTIKKRCSSKNTRTLKTTKKTESAKVSASIDLSDKKIGGKSLLEGAKKTKKQHCPRKISATPSPRLQKKKSNLLDSSKNSVRQANNSASLEISRSDSIELIEQNNGISLQSDGGINRNSSRDEVDVTSEYRLKQIGLVREEDFIGKRLICTVEQPSPVSVLDLTIYEDESPSPVRLISNTCEDVEVMNHYETKFSTNLINRYIAEILDSSSILQLHQSGNPMLENTCLALQEINISPFREAFCSKEVLERRLIFNVVNEILGRKVEAYNRVSLNHRQKVWTNSTFDISEVAADIERMIFKDLIIAVVRSESSWVRACGSGYRRKLL